MLMLARKRRTAKSAITTNPKPPTPTPVTEPSDGPRRRRGRPMKKFSELKPPRKFRTELAKILHQQNTSKMACPSSKPNSMSTLESLPVELIQQIFFHSFEVNLPRASPHLNKALSKPSIYTALVLFAYFDHDGESPVETHHFKPAEYRRISVDDQIRIQKGILGCKWCTLDMIKSCMPALSRLQMTQAWYREHLAERKLNIPMEPRELSVPQVPNETLRPVAALPALDDQEAMEKHFLAKLEPPSNGTLGFAHPQPLPGARQPKPTLGPTGHENHLPRIMQWSSSADENRQLHKTVHQGVSTVAARVLPDAILRGNPWTDSKITLLQLLRQGMRFLASEHVLELSADALFAGMASAIREGSERALLVLLELHSAVMKLHPAHDPAYFIDRTTPKRRHLVGPFAHPLPISLFHLACQTQTEKQDSTARILALLLREGLDTVPSDDNMLTRWASHAKAHPASAYEYALASWLLKHMLATNDYGLGRGDPLFVNGMLSWRRREGDYPFLESTFTSEIGYVYEGAVAGVVRARDGGPCG
ncbi:uncharacterized protein Z518_06229 [Rhinocladiella mackenziei CBS 650.93]|uniref:Uncharacterized protein n=1 Tax=Rhinocladiella mackenziei CBS 650.93 TaxID=1442369 RepID=A0A0D2FTD2_9EURO|nr:uncharacterized protein Z518_06229 [Rhinocladiella mackenziei CBS 650.93]KIX05357.1 hypothetical protein Z518_06229 [Rhinocladiella mackenziei CBS 650.93]